MFDGRGQMQRASPTKRDPVARPKLAELVQNRLLAVIKAENLQPGDALPSERELMQSYAVGRPSIREAMQNLKRMGLIEINHGERPRVAAPSFERMLADMSETMRHVLMNSPATLDHLKEARASFEMTIAQIAARRRTIEDVEDLRWVLAEQERARLELERFPRSRWPVSSSHRRHDRQSDICSVEPGALRVARALSFRSGSQAGPRTADACRASPNSGSDRARGTAGGRETYWRPFEPGQYALQSSQLSRMTPPPL